MNYIITYTQRIAIVHGEGTDYSYREGLVLENDELDIAEHVFKSMQDEEEYSDIMRNF